MPSIPESAKRIRIAWQLAAEDSAPSGTARRPASTPIPLTSFSASAPRQGGRTADAADAQQKRGAYLNRLDRATRHVRRTGQDSTTAATDRGAAQHAPPSSSPPPSSPSEDLPPDLTQTTPSTGSGWTIAGLWRKARGIDLEAEADRNPIGFLGILIALASLIVAVLGLVWTVVQGIASLALEARSSSAGEVTRQARRRIEAAWTNVRRRADKFAHHIGLSLPAPPSYRIHARQWDQPRQEKRDP